MGGKLITGQETLIHSIYQHQCKYKLPCQSLMRPVLTNDLNSLISPIVLFSVNHQQHFSVWGWPLDLDSSTYAQIFPKVLKITFYDAIFNQRVSKSFLWRRDFPKGFHNHFLWCQYIQTKFSQLVVQAGWIIWDDIKRRIRNTCVIWNDIKPLQIIFVKCADDIKYDKKTPLSFEMI